jgi:hypothetical protein
MFFITSMELRMQAMKFIQFFFKKNTFLQKSQISYTK